MADDQPESSAPVKKPVRPAQVFKADPKVFPDAYEQNMINYIRTATCKNVWYYRDRCGVSRGPATLPVLKEAWVHGIVDENTLVWGQGLIDFLPIKNVRTLVPQIRTPEGAPSIQEQTRILKKLVHAVTSVRAATWVKKQFALKPALAKARRERAEFRLHQSDQVDNMY